MFDFSSEVSLDKKNYSLYRKLQILLYLVAFLSAIYLSYLIIFPHKNYYFSFLNPNSKENNLDIPLSSNKEPVYKETLLKEEKIYFNTTIPDKYSKVSLNLKLNQKAQNSLEISAQKSHKAFLYETGDPIGFKDGTLLKNNESYFIISNGSLRKFSSPEIIDLLGFSKDSFLNVTDEELKYNPIGKDVTETYPDGSLFLIDKNYYILENQNLKKFVSDQAFFLSYKNIKAIEKNVDIFEKYPLSEDMEGFPDGTLASNDISVYVLSENKFYPIDNPQTFLSKGYTWEDIIPIGTDELSIYEKQGTFNIRDSHPNGTVFKTIENSTYFIVKDGKKHPLLSKNIAFSWISKTPILVSEKSLETKITCEEKISFLNSKRYICQIPLEKLSEFSGSNYQFEINPKKEVTINTININYQKNINTENLKEFIIKIINEIKVNYGIE